MALNCVLFSFLGTSGQPVADLYRYATSGVPVEDYAAVLAAGASGSSDAAGVLPGQGLNDPRLTGFLCLGRPFQAAMPCVPCPGDASAKAAGSPVDALECFLRWRHLAPTAPDTLGTVMRTGFPERLVDGPAGGSRGSCDLRATVCFFQQRATRFMTPIPSSSRTHPTCFLLGTKNRTRRDCALVGCHNGREPFLQVIGDARLSSASLA